MRRMYSEAEVKALIQEYAPEVSPEDIQKMFDDGDVSLAGKYVRIMDAPKSSTLTDEQIALISEGVFVNGTFGDYKNPVFFPYNVQNGYKGCFIGRSQEYTVIGYYNINTTTKVISLSTTIMIDFAGNLTLNNARFINGSSGNKITITNLAKINGFDYPIASSQDGISSGDVVTLDSSLDKALKAHMEVEINGHRCRFESEEESGNTTYIIYSSFGEVSATGKLTANIISYNKSTREISFNQMTFTPDA